MDHQRDFVPFQRLISRLCVTFDKFATEELVESWWKALRREDLQRLTIAVDAFIARADDKTKFPKPGQFSGGAAYADHSEFVTRESRRHWDSFISRFPTTGPIRLKLALCSRIFVTEREDSPAYAEALAEERWLLKQLGENGRFCADR